MRAQRVSKADLFHKLGYVPHAGQVDVHLSRAPRRVLACGVRFGKTMCAAMEGVAATMQPAERSVGWVVAPTYDLANRVFTQIVITVSTKLQHRILSLKEHEHRLVLRNLGGGVSEIRAKSADSPVSLLGEGLDWVVIDEAARVKATIWQSYISQRLIDRKGWALLISTPRGKGYFYDLFKRGQGADPDYKSWNLASWANPLLDREAIEEERTRIPERVFLQEFAAQFLEGSGCVFRNVRERALLDWQAPVHGERYFAGLDLAKVEDYTVLVVMNRRREVVFVDRFHRLDWSLQVTRIKAAAERYNRASILVDSTGAGEPIFEALRAAGCRNIEPYAFTARSKTDLINSLSLLLEKSEITLPKADVWPDGIDELEGFEYSVTDTGNVKTGAVSGVHDDCVIALALAAWHAKRAPAPPKFYSTNNWSDVQRLMRRMS
jgi:hypothetical protein